MNNTAVAVLGLLAGMASALPPSSSDDPTCHVRTEWAEPGASPATIGPLDPIENTPEMKALRAELAAVSVTRDVGAIKRVHARIQQLYLLSQPAQQATVTAQELAGPPVGFGFVEPDVLIVQGPARGIAAAYTMDGTMYAAAGLPDSTIRVYRSTDHGSTWDYVNGVLPTPHALYDRIALCVTRGDSARIHLFLIHPSGSGDVYTARFKLDGSYLGLTPVHAGVDTVGDIAFTHDFDNLYYIYGCAYSTIRPSGTGNGRMLRSTDYGVTWAVTNTFSNLNQVSYQNGAGRWQYLASPVRSSTNKGRINTVTNHNYGDPAYWFETMCRPDTFYIEEPVMCPAFTMPESSAVTWLAYHHFNPSGNPFSVMTHYSDDGIVTWSSRHEIASEPGAGDVWPDLQSYHDPGNTWMNISYISLLDDYRRVFRRYTNAGDPGNWSDTLRINSAQALRSHERKPLLVYSPGAPGTGGSCVFVHYESPEDLVWNGPWNTGFAEQPVPGERPVALGIAANPVAGSARFNWSGNALLLAIYDGAGRLVRRYDRPTGSTATWDRRDRAGRPVRTGIYVVRLTTDNGTATRSIVLK